MKVLSLSHSDLDGIGSQIVLERAFGLFQRMNISYGSIDEYLDIVQDYCTNNSPDSVFVTDLAFSYGQLQGLHKIAILNSHINFYFIDHHPFAEEYKHLNLDNFKIVISSKASGTKLTKLYTDKNFNIAKDPEFDKFVDYINAYDIWLKDTPEFKIGFVYNELFWKYGINHFYSRFKQEYKLRNSDKDTYKQIVAKKTKLFNKLDSSGRFLRIGEKDILIVFLDDYQGFLTLDYPDHKVYVIINSIGRVSIRLSAVVRKQEVNDYALANIKLLSNVETAGGHVSAFGVKLKNKTPHDLIMFAKDIMHIMDKALFSVNERS